MEILKQLQAITVATTATIRDALRSVERGGLFVVLLVNADGGRFCGLVTDSDLRRALQAGFGLESPVADVPRSQAITASVGTPLEELSRLLNEHTYCVPLLDCDGSVVELAIGNRRAWIPVAEPLLGERELQYVAECVLTGWVSSAGKFVKRFEEVFANFCGARYAIATSSGTTALHLALLALNIGPSDEVIVPTLTFIATANAVTYTGASPVFADSDPYTWTIDPKQIEAAITSRTKAIIPVHLYGHPADMDPILDIAGHHNLAVVEDAAEAHGACYKGRRVGIFGDVGCFSFYGNKIITTGEGGMVVTNRSDLAERVRILRDHGMSFGRPYWHSALGYNYRLTNLQAAVGVAQMERVEEILAAKRRIGQAYRNALNGITTLRLPPEAPWAKNVYWLYSILVDENTSPMGRDALMIELKNRGIETRPLFSPVHTQPVYSTGRCLPIAERLAVQGLSLPSGVTLSSTEIQRVAETVAGLIG